MDRSFMEDCEILDSLEIEKFPRNGKYKFKLHISIDQLGDTVYVPVILIRGANPGPRTTIAAAIHGDELNGTFLCYQMMQELDPTLLKGDLVLIPIVNVLGFKVKRREFIDGTDLNRVMPGKKNGLPGEVFAYHFFNKVIVGTDYLFDLHTASKGRINTLYTRANLDNSKVEQLIKYQRTPIVLHASDKTVKTLRKAAEDNNVTTLTIEIGNPNIYQKKYVREVLLGILHCMQDGLQILSSTRDFEFRSKTICRSSNWLRTTNGGLLEVEAELYDTVYEGERVAVIRDAFGHIIQEYFAPYDGIVIGIDRNPVSIPGDRIIHLGKT
ncbi:MAG: succinylglutamate desuccinylase/aspartoacylase family protein [Bacteriovoracaceae bacterium]|nr:succinylglutamate desuccinylase/aspartoacylase family protein [Bacteriovoracaceae bacterium]